jgi:hypothetical protein
VYENKDKKFRSQDYKVLKYKAEPFLMIKGMIINHPNLSNKVICVNIPAVKKIIHDPLIDLTENKNYFRNDKELLNQII